MKARLLIDLILGFALQFFQAQGDKSAQNYVEKIIAYKAAGINVDSYLQEVADYLLGGERPDWDGLIGRVNKAVDELAAKLPDDQPDPE